MAKSICCVEAPVSTPEKQQWANSALNRQGLHPSQHDGVVACVDLSLNRAFDMRDNAIEQRHSEFRNAV